jgi:hypothetical protein
MMLTLKYLLLPLLVGALALAACGGGDDDDSPIQQDGITCVPLTAFKSYRFEARGVSEVVAPEVTPPAGSTPAGPPPFRFVLNVTGESQGADRMSAVVTQGEGSNPGSTIVVGDTVWVLLNGIWSPNAVGPVSPIPYRPIDACSALAPGLSVAGLSSTPEDVNGIPSLHYHLEAPNDFFGRHANFGPSSDYARVIENVTIDVWLAEDGQYPTKADVSGTARYPDGSTLNAEVSYEISDVGASDIQITPPAIAG